MPLAEILKKRFSTPGRASSIAMSSAGFHGLADKIVTRALTNFKPSPLTQGMLRSRQAQIVLRLRRFKEAEQLAEEGVEAMIDAGDRALPFCCLERALLARGMVRGTRYSHANAPVSVLLAATEDARAALSTSDPRLLAIATAMLVKASALLCFAGLSAEKFRPYLEAPIKMTGLSKADRAKANWSRALLICAQLGTLDDEAEELFRGARATLVDVNRVDAVIELTIDLQFWLVVANRFADAHSESVIVSHHLSDCALPEAERKAVASWLFEIAARCLSVQTAQSVLGQVRMVTKLENLPLLLGHG